MWSATGELPAHLATERPASLIIFPGEVYDFVFTPMVPDTLTLRFWRGGVETRVPVEVTASSSAEAR